MAIDALRQTFPASLHIPVHFSQIGVSAKAMYVSGRDDGSYDRLRQEFTQRFQLPEQTRRPPEIIHTTVARFLGEYDLAEIRELLASQSVNFTQTTAEFDLIHETTIFAQDFEVLQHFPAVE